MAFFGVWGAGLRTVGALKYHTQYNNTTTVKGHSSVATVGSCRVHPDLAYHHHHRVMTDCTAGPAIMFDAIYRD